MGFVGNLYERLVMISPGMEILLRKVYWHNVKYLKRFRPYNPPSKKEAGNTNHVDFEEIINYLKTKGIGEGSLLVVHSSYDHLECTGLTPEEIVERLLQLVGPTGTLAMPAMRKYKGEPTGADRLTVNTDNLVCTYKPRKTMVKTGWLPLAMVQRKDSVISRHPIDTMVAIGPLAEEMMAHNLEGETPAPHGPGSSWAFCYNNGAIVIGLGVDLYHYNSICHVNEEAFGNWPFKDEEWYRIRKFHIIDDNYDKVVMVKERKPEWGMLRLAEKHSDCDISRNNLIAHRSIGGIDIYIEEAKAIIDHLQDNTTNGICFYL